MGTLSKYLSPSPITARLTNLKVSQCHQQALEQRTKSLPLKILFKEEFHL